MLSLLFLGSSFPDIIFSMQNNTLISKNLLQDFKKQNKLSSTVEFLFHIQQKRHLQRFYVFCEKNNCILPKFVSSTILFHGSTNMLTMLEPNTSVDQDGKKESLNLVYATDDPNYAIFLAILDIRESGGASVHTPKSRPIKLSISLGFINGPSKFKDGYIHIVSGSDFKKKTNKEYVSNRKTRVLFSVPVSPKDLTVPICVKI